MKTYIYKNQNGDTRSCKTTPEFKDFQNANDMHIQDVRNVINNLAFELMLRGQTHDKTKKSLEDMFYNDLMNTINNGGSFVEGDWFKIHINEERHHLLSNCPDDVNLFDVIEMIVDCVCAGKARSNEIRELEINEDILKRALDNTVKKISDMVVVNG